MCRRIRQCRSTGVETRWVRLESAQTVGPWFRWASVGIDCATRLADDVGLTVTAMQPIGSTCGSCRDPGRRRVKTSPLREHRSHRAGGPGARRRRRGLLRHRPDQSLHPAPAAVVLLADAPGLAVSARLRACTSPPASRRFRCSSSSCGRCGPSCSSGPFIGGPVRAARTPVDPRPGRVDAVPAQHRAAEHRAVVRVQVLLHHQPLRHGVRGRRRGGRARRGQAAGDPAGAWATRSAAWATSPTAGPSARRGARC